MRFPIAVALLALVACDKKDDVPAPQPAKAAKAKATADAPPTESETPAPQATPGAKPAEEAPAAPAVPARAKGEMPAVLDDIPAASTIGGGGVEGMDAMVRTFDAVVAALPAGMRKDAPPELLDPAARAAKLGADLTTAEGWTEFGVDASAGAAVTLNSQLPDGPVIYLRATDINRLIKRLTDFGAKIEAKGSADGVGEYTVDGKVVYLGRRGASSVIYAPAQPSPEAKAKFVALLGDKGAALSADKTTERTFNDLGQGARYWVFGKVGQALDFAAKTGGQPAPHADFIKKRLLAFGMAAGPETGGLRWLTDEKAADALAQILKPARPTARFARYFGSRNNLILRVTVNIANMFDGVAALVPPELADVRGKIMVAKNSVPILVGVQLADLAKAFSGHVAVALDADKLQTPNPDFAALLDVHDAAAADTVVKTILDRMAKMQKVPNAPLEIAGQAGFRVGQGAAEVVVVRHEQALFIGRQGMVERLLGNKTPPPGPLAQAIDDDTFYGFVADIGLLTKNLPPGAPFDAGQVEQIVKAVLGDDLAGGHLSGGLKIDQQGVVATNARSSAMIIGVLAAIAIPAFVKYIRRSKAVEARLMLRSITSAMTLKSLEQGFQLQAAPRTPAQKSCDKYGPDPAAWAHPGWKAIDFKIESPHYFQYELAVQGDTFTARAYGDLDCDDVDSVYEIAGKIVDGQIELQPLQVRDELE